MTMKEMLEAYVVILEANAERLEKSLERTKREIASDAEHGHRISGLESLAQNAREKEIEHDVVSDVLRNLKDILRGTEE